MKPATYVADLEARLASVDGDLKHLRERLPPPAGTAKKPAKGDDLVATFAMLRVTQMFHFELAEMLDAWKREEPASHAGELLEEKAP